MVHPPDPSVLGATPIGHQTGSMNATASAAAWVTSGTGSPASSVTTTSVPSGRVSINSEKVSSLGAASSAGAVPSLTRGVSSITTSSAGGVSSVVVDSGKGGASSSAKAGTVLIALKTSTKRTVTTNMV